MDCKSKTKTRLGSNYSYYQILIVEDTQPITYMRKQSESWIKSMSYRTASRSWYEDPRVSHHHTE